MPVVTAVATGSKARSGNHDLSRRVAAAMAKAVERCQKEGITDPIQVRTAILTARAIVRGEAVPDLDRVPTLIERVTEDQRAAQLGRSIMLEEVTRVLLSVDRSVALGAAISLLLQSAESHPLELTRALRCTMVSRGTQTVCALQALVDVTN